VGPLILVFCLLLSSAAVAGGDHDHTHDVPDSRRLGGNVPRTFPDGDVFLPKPSQRLLRVRTTPAAQSETRPGTELVGTVIADPSTEGRVQAPMDGSIALANDKVSFVGETVKAGDLLALLAPTMPVYERGYLEQLAADVEGKLRIAEQRLHRLRNISDGYVAQREIDDTLTELEALREQKRVLAPKSEQKLELRAPVDGVISVSNVRPGQVVNTRDTLFEIVDPEKLWIEAVGLPGQDHVAIVAAHAVLGDGRKVPLTYLGRSPALRNHARPIFFTIDAEPEAFAIGAAVKIVVQSGEALTGYAIPEAAVMRGPAGLPQIWEKVGAERFKPVPVRVVPLDGANVLVTAGLEAGSRVVVEGAEFINQVR
jgi:multidrug efflux pump subunit AcrA (membrane-fusion protein)